MRIDPPAAASRASRLPLLDAARGLAVIAMAIYHFSWDLRYFGYITADVEGALGWVVFARSIAGSFLLIVGISLVLSVRRGFRLRPYLRRLAILVASALAITVVTWKVFPDAYIFFGVLHEIAVASVLGLAFVWAPVWLTLAAAAFMFAGPHFLVGPAFDHPALLWLGLATEYPRTNDFVPLFPWFGVVLVGIAATRLWQRLGLGRAAGMRVPAPLLWVGRHSLLIYLLHQPVLFGLVAGADRIHPPDLLGFEPQFLEECRASCEAGDSAAICERTCGCIAGRTQAAGLWRDLMRQSLTPEETQSYYAVADACRAAAEPP
jgi:uncharacterized membrane protein